jgi:hypothetical protein
VVRNASVAGSGLGILLHHSDTRYSFELLMVLSVKAAVFFWMWLRAFWYKCTCCLHRNIGSILPIYTTSCIIKVCLYCVCSWDATFVVWKSDVQIALTCNLFSSCMPLWCKYQNTDQLQQLLKFRISAAVLNNLRFVAVRISKYFFFSEGWAGTW